MQEEDFSLFPNPTSDRFEINNLSGDAGNTMVKVYDNRGKIMKELTVFGKDKKIIIDARGWDAGLYFVTVVIDQKETATRKIMVK